MAGTTKELFSQMSEHFYVSYKPVSQRHYVDEGITKSTAQFDTTGIHLTYIVLQILRTSLYMAHAVMTLI